MSSDNPSFLALSPDQRFLFAINEVNDFEGEEAGSVEAYRIDEASGEIALINRQALPGLAHGIDERGLTLGGRFLAEILAG